MPIDTGDEDALQDLLDDLEQLLRQRRAEGRCCHRDCLHCAYRGDGSGPGG